MLDITLLCIGKIKDKSYASLLSEYQKRLQPFARLKVVELEAQSFSEQTKERAKEFEGEKIENYLSKLGVTLVYLLAERGLSLASVDFAYWLERKSPLVLVLGGALGFSDHLYEKYPCLSLSPLTFPHELARVILFEQLYRASTILTSKKYHY